MGAHCVVHVVAEALQGRLGGVHSDGGDGVSDTAEAQGASNCQRGEAIDDKGSLIGREGEAARVNRGEEMRVRHRPRWSRPVPVLQSLAPMHEGSTEQCQCLWQCRLPPMVCPQHVRMPRVQP